MYAGGGTRSMGERLEAVMSPPSEASDPQSPQLLARAFSASPANEFSAHSLSLEEERAIKFIDGTAVSAEALGAER